MRSHEGCPRGCLEFLLDDVTSLSEQAFASPFGVVGIIREDQFLQFIKIDKLRETFFAQVDDFGVKNPLKVTSQASGIALMIKMLDVAKNIHEDVLYHVLDIINVADLPLAPVHKQWMVQFAKRDPIWASIAYL